MRINVYLATILAFALSVILTVAFGATLTVISPTGPYPSSVSADGLDFTWTSATTAIDSFSSTGSELLLIYYPAGTTATVTLDSVPDVYNRENDIVYTLSAGDYAAFWFGNTAGWRNATGEIQIQSSTTALKWAVIRIP